MPDNPDIGWFVNWKYSATKNAEEDVGAANRQILQGPVDIAPNQRTTEKEHMANARTPLSGELFIDWDQVDLDKEIPLSDGPYPESVSGAVAAVAREGKGLRFSNDEYDRVAAHADLLLEKGLHQAGLEFLPTSMKLLVQRALTHNMVKYYAPLGDGERKEVIKVAGLRVFDKALNVLDHRLRDLGPAEGDPQPPVDQYGYAKESGIKASRGLSSWQTRQKQRERYTQAYARLKGWHSRLKDGDPRATLVTRQMYKWYTDWKLEQDRLTTVENSGVQEELSRITPESLGAQLEVVDRIQLRAGQSKIKYRFQDSMAEMWDDVKTALRDTENHYGAEQSLSMSLRGSVKEARLRSFGTTNEEVKGVGLFATLFKTHPMLMAEVMRAGTDRQLKLADDYAKRTNSEMSWEKREELKQQSLFHILYRISSIGAPREREALQALEARQITGAETIEEMQGAMVDDAKGYLTTGMLNFMGAAHTISGRAVSLYNDIRGGNFDVVNGLAKRTDQLVEGLGSEALKRLDSYMGYDGEENYGLGRESLVSAQLVEGVEKGEIPAEAVSRVLGKDSGATMLVWGIFDTLAGGGASKALTERLQKWSGVKLHPEALKEVSDRFRAEFTNETLKPPGFNSLVELEDWYVSRMALASRSVREGKMAQGYSLAFSASIVDQLYTGMWEVGGFMLKDPETVGAMAVAGFLGGQQLAKAGKKLDLHGMASRMTLNHRLRKNIKDLVAHDPFYASTMQAYLRQNSDSFVRKGVFSERRLREMDGALRVYGDDSLMDANRLANLTDTDIELMKKKRANPRVWRQLDKDLRKFDTGALEKMLDLDHQSADLVKYLRDPVRFSPVVQFVEDVVERTGYAQRRFNPRMRARAGNILGKISNMVDQGASVERFKSILFPFSGAVGPDKQSIWARLVRRFPYLSKTFGALDAAKTSLLVKGAKFLQEAMPTINALRDYNSVLTGRQHRFVRAVHNRTSGELADYSASLFLNGGDELLPLEAERLTKMQSTLSRLEELKGQVDIRDWKHPVKLSRHPDVMKNTSVGEILLMINQDEPMATHQLWAMLRSPGESLDNFRGRWQKLVGEETDFLDNKMLPDKVSTEQFQHNLRRAKKELLEGYYDQQDMQQIARLDLAEPDKPAFRPFKEAEALYTERVALSRAAANGDKTAIAKVADNPDIYKADTDYGFRTITPDEEWKELRRWAQTYDAESMAYIRDAAPVLDPGDMGSFLAYAAEGGQEARNRFHYYTLRNQHNAEVYANMNKARRAAFDTAVTRLADGDGRDWADLMKKDKELGALLGEGPDADVFEGMWRNNEEMRGMLMDWAHKAGMIDENVHDYFLKYYAPHRYKYFTFRELNPKWYKKAAHKVVEEHSEAKLLEFEEFARQRDHYKHKVLLKRDGGVWIKRKFATSDEAMGWLDENIGLRRKGIEAEGDLIKEDIMSVVDGNVAGSKYKTFMDDEAVVLKPIGEDMLDMLRPHPAGENLFERMGKLARDVSFYNYLKMFDRPGWVLDADTFKKMAPRQRNAWVEVPGGANGWGPFKGKYLHNRAAKRIQDYIEIDSALDDMRKNMTKVIQESYTFGPMIWAHKAIAGLGGTARFFKRIIANSRIQRNVRTISGNVMWDKQKTARAVDPMYLYDPKAREAERFAYKTLLGADGWLGSWKGDPNMASAVNKMVETGSVRKGGWFDPTVPIDPDSAPFLREAVQHGIIGDTPLGSHLTGKDRALALRLQYGNGLAKPVRRRVAQAVAKGVKPVVEAAAKGFTKIPGHQRAKDAYNKLLKRLGFNEGESVGEVVGKYFTGTPDYEGQALRREITELDGMLDDVNTGVRDIEPAMVMQLQYEREGKVMALKSVMDDSMKGKFTDAVNGLGYIFGAKSAYGRFGSMSNWSHDFYQRLGNVHKLGAYMYMRGKGVPETVATQRIRMFMQNYNALPSSIRAIQRSDMATVANPVFSFGYEFWRIQKNIMMHHPEHMAAMWALAPTTSFMSMAANGHNVADIWKTEAKNDGWFDASVNAIRTLYLPTPDGGYSTHRMTYMDEFAVLGKPTGVLGDVVDNAKAHGDVLTGMAARGVAPFFLENLQTNAAYSVLTGRDPLTQKKLEGGFSGTMASAARQVGRMAQPGWVPWSGDMHDLLSTYRRPPRLRTRFVTEASERLLQVMGGYVTRGGFWSQIADGSTGLKCSEHVNNLLLKSAAIGEKFDLPLQALGAASDRRMVIGPDVSVPANPLRARGFNDRDIFLTLFYANAKFGDNYEESGRDGVQNFAQDDMFAAAHLVHEGKKRKDDNMVSVGLQLRDGSIARISERMGAQEQFAELRKLDPEAYQDEVNDEILRTTRNAAQNMDMTYAFNRGALRQKIATLVEASALGLDTDLVEEGAQIMLWTPRFNFSHSMDFNNAATLQSSLVDLEAHLNNPGPGATGVGMLALLYDQMSRALPDVLQRDALKVFNDDIQARAFELLEEEVQQ